MTIPPDTSHPPSLQVELAPIIPSMPPEVNLFSNLPLIHQCNETSKESAMPILPMPEGYIPSPPPPLLSPPNPMFFTMSPNLNSFNEAFHEIESQNTMTGMPCFPPHIHYQFNHFIRSSESSPMLTTSSTPIMSSITMPVKTPSTAPTLIPTMSSSSTSASTMQYSIMPAITPSRMMAAMTPSSILALTMLNSTAVMPSQTTLAPCAGTNVVLPVRCSCKLMCYHQLY
ncbi:hypothetical protein BDR06DRAFT_1000861 [Suillus hirtellus]|nr:hypothetical protein BDR06DRAFT_1000861 [Suillus hirtellus]